MQLAASGLVALDGKQLFASRTSVTAARSAALITFLALTCLCGCGGPEKPSPATQPQGVSNALPPLPRKATLKLDELEPKIIKPVNLVGWDTIAPRAQDDFKAAANEMKRGDYTAVIERLERARGFDQNSAPIRRMLGMAYVKILNNAQALANLTVVVKNAPDDLEAQVLIGRIVEAQKQTDRAILAYRTALKCSQVADESPRVGEALWRLGQLLATGGYHTAALECFDRLQENITVHGRVYARSADLRAIVIRPERLLAWRGELHMNLRRPVKAADLLGQAYRRHRTNIRTARQLMRALLAAKRFEQAEKMLQEMAGEPILKGLATEMTKALCDASGDSKLPVRIWNAHRAGGGIDGQLAVTLARSAEQLGGPDDAAAILESVMHTMPGNVAVGRHLAKLHMARKDWSKAIRLLAGLVEANLNAREEVIVGLEDLASREISPDFERNVAAQAAATKSPSPYALYYVAGAMAEIRQKPALANELYEKSLADKADFLPAAEALAKACITLGDFGRAQALIASLEKEPKARALVHLIRGHLHLAEGRPRQAVEELEQALAGSSDLAIRLALADAYDQKGNVSGAIRTLIQGVKSYASNETLHSRLFRLYMRMRDEATVESLRARYFAGATDIVARISVWKPRSTAVRIMQTELDAKAGKDKRTEEARKTLKVLQREMPSSPEIKLLAVRVELAGTKELTDAQRGDLALRLREIRKSKAYEVEATFLLDRLLAADSSNADMLGMLKELHEQHPGNARVSIAYSRRLSQSGEHLLAAQVMEKVAENDPSSAGLRLKLVELMLKADKKSQAGVHGNMGLQAIDNAEQAFRYRMALSKLYEDAEAYDQLQALLDDWILVAGSDRMIISLRQNKITTYAKAGQLDEAENYANDWLKQSPQLLEPRRAIIWAFVDAEDYTSAHKLLDEWLAKTGVDELAPTTQPTELTTPQKIAAFCREIKVRLLMIEGKYAAALAAADKFLKANPNDTEIMSIKSSCLSELDRPKEALAVLEKAYEAVPDDKGLNNNLGYMYAERGIKLAQAERMIRTALAKERPPGVPLEISFMDSLAWVFYKQGRLQEAEQQFQRILAREDFEYRDHPVIYDHVGDTLYRLGKSDKAVAMWTKALERAKTAKADNMELRTMRKGAQAKIKAVKAGEKAQVSPLGEGVEPEAPSDKPEKEVAEEVQSK